ncbi:hypothetical protein KFZ76_06915 [Methylovulum psychrotolerans]|uniref:hypothetical protein n=1 Tax=Methylovulum psychrotolerans TaxID=1704499 RepID=UPI001BFF7311|nr:hypothetical protein [Methylovulum psychrotolerans]MBT9097441.1 hypothetical protein [Methylovulum psychrotolerans]
MVGSDGGHVILSVREANGRWGLSYLHSRYSLNGLARAVAHKLGKSGKHCEVSVESIWIDGTPQAKAQTSSGAIVNCELADLLFLLEEKDVSGMVQKETALLIQGKATPKYNKLTSGSSTKKERKLLESMDRSMPLVLFKDTKSSSKSQIGSYILGCIPLGLGDCSRYLLMPKSAAWFAPCYLSIAPFQVGWPSSINSPYLKRPRSVVEAIQRMALFGDIGKEVIDPSKCEWSRLVNDLRGNYAGIHMAGYGGQARINTSREVISFASRLHTSYQSSRNRPPNHPPMTQRSDMEENIVPSISIVKVSITYTD